ncbi:flippase-like domain-containing protein [bacterium]|nr:flippase-like domain-containing protein [bacterium]
MKWKKRAIAIMVSVTLLGVLIASVDVRTLGSLISRANLIWFTVALLFFLPQTFAIAYRWTLIARPVAPIDWREAGRQVLASSCLNLVLPSKLGDLAKGVFLFRQGRCRLEDGIQIVVFEKLMDLAALSAWMIIGWILAPNLAWWVLATLGLGFVIIAVVYSVYFIPRGRSILYAVVPGFVQRNRKFQKIEHLLEAGPRVMQVIHASGDRRGKIIVWSFIIWLLHLLQIYCFFQAMHADAGLFGVLARVPIAIFAGLLPIAVAGIGVRDWAIVAIFGSAANPRALLVGVGLLVSLRYVVPAAAGLAFVGRYFTMAKAARTSTADS